MNIWTISLFPYNFIILFIVAFLFLLMCVFLKKKNLITNKNIIHCIFLCCFISYAGFIQLQLSRLKNDFENNDYAIRSLQDNVVYNKPMFSAENGELINTEDFDEDGTPKHLNTTNHKLYMMFFKGIAEDITRIEAKISDNDSTEIKKLQSKYDGLGRDVSFLKMRENQKEMKEISKKLGTYRLLNPLNN